MHRLSELRAKPIGIQVLLGVCLVEVASPRDRKWNKSEAFSVERHPRVELQNELKRLKRRDADNNSCLSLHERTHMVTEATKQVIVDEFILAAKVVKDILNRILKWEDLFVEYDFFANYRRFIRIDALAKNEKDFKKWKGSVELKIR